MGDYDVLDRGFHAPSWLIDLPQEMRSTVFATLVSHATNQYLKFFHDTDVQHPSYRWQSGVKKALLLPDDEAADALYEIVDNFPYSWPTDVHPNWTFCDDMLWMVDWKLVLSTLRKEAENDHNL